MTQPIYAIGDIHGQLELLEEAFAKIERDGGLDAQVIFLGDYVDRGANSKAVIERLIAGKTKGRNWRFLKGNHDRMFEWFLQSPPRHDPHMLVGYHWLHERLGGIETLASYDVTFPEGTRLEDVHADALGKVPLSHIRFLQSCELAIHRGPLYFCHAGVRPGVPLSDQVENDLVWIRQSFSDSTADHGALIVHGHTPVKAPLHAGNHVNLDTGAAYGGPLTVARFDSTEIHVLTDTGAVALNPSSV